MSALKEPRKHTKLYHQVIAQLVAGDSKLNEAIKAVVELMVDHELMPKDVKRIASYLDERGRWRMYNVRQGIEDEPVEVDLDEDEDLEL